MREAVRSARRQPGFQKYKGGRSRAFTSNIVMYEVCSARTKSSRPKVSAADERGQYMQLVYALSTDFLTNTHC